MSKCLVGFLKMTFGTRLKIKFNLPDQYNFSSSNRIPLTDAVVCFSNIEQLEYP